MADKARAGRGPCRVGLEPAGLRLEQRFLHVDCDQGGDWRRHGGSG